MSPDKSLTDIRPRITFDELDTMMTYLVRSAMHFLQARHSLKPEHFKNEYETGFRILWSELGQYYDQYSHLPGRILLETAVMSRLDSETVGTVDSLIIDSVRRDLSIFLAACFEVNMSELPDAPGFALLQKFLSERDVFDPLKDYLGVINGHVPAIPGLIKALSDRAIKTGSIGADLSGGIIPDVLPSRSVLEVTPTNQDFFDKAVGGGLRRGQSIGLLGALGSGKTSLALDLSLAVAKNELAKSVVDPSYQPDTSVFVTYEQSRIEIQIKAIAAAARIPLDRIGLYEGWLDKLSTSTKPESLLQYEYALVSGENRVPAGELERYKSDVLPIEKSGLWRVIDLSGSTENPGAGKGYVDEICSALEVEKRKGVKGFGLVVIDYALLACRNYVRSKAGTNPRE